MFILLRNNAVLKKKKMYELFFIFSEAVKSASTVQMLIGHL